MNNKVFGIIFIENEVIFFTARGDYIEHFYQKHGLESYSSLTFMGK